MVKRIITGKHASINSKRKTCSHKDTAKPDNVIPFNKYSNEAPSPFDEDTAAEREWHHNYCLKLGLKIIQFMSRVVRCRESHAERQMELWGG